MKKPISLALSLVMITAVLVGSASAAPLIVNGGFETGDFTGWTLTLPSGASASVVTSFTSDQGLLYSPVEGNYFAVLKTNGANLFTKLSQVITIPSGAWVEGWAAFDARDHLPFNDTAYVRIYDETGTTLLATPWFSDVAKVGNYGDDP